MLSHQVDKMSTEEIITIVFFLLNMLKDSDEPKKQEQTVSTVSEHSVELLTIKGCLELAPELSEYSLRRLIKSNKVASIRNGNGNGRYLVNKESLINYLRGLRNEQSELV